MSKKKRKNLDTSPTNEITIENKNDTKITTLKQVITLIRSNAVFFGLIAGLIFIIYANLINGEFLSADDLPGIVENPMTKNMAASIATLKIQPVYFALIYKIFGMNSWAFHFGSILMHMLNTILVFVFVYLVFGKRTATAATLLFAAHPLNSEAVGWIAGNGYLYFALLTLLTLIFFALYKNSGNKNYLITSAVLYLLGMFTLRNPWTLVNPFLIVIMDQFIYEKRIQWKNIKIYLPFLITSLAFVYKWLFIDAGKVVETLQKDYYFNPNENSPWINRVPYTIFMTLKLYLFPNELTIYHEGKIIPMWYYSIMIAVSVLLIITILVLIKKHRAIAGLLMMIFASILPSFSPVVIAWFVADRYMYTGSIFFCVILTTVIFGLEKRYKISKLSKYALSIIMVAYSFRTFVRAQDYKTNEAFWLATQKLAPLSYRVYNNLGDVYARKGNYPLAIEYFSKSVQIKPDFADAIHNIGFTYFEMGDLENAKKYLLLSYQVNPGLYPALFKLGVIEYQQKNYQQAKDYMLKALEVNPNYTEARNAIATIDSVINSQPPAQK